MLVDGVSVSVLGVLGILKESLDCIVEFRDIPLRSEAPNNCDTLKDEKEGL